MNDWAKGRARRILDAACDPRWALAAVVLGGLALRILTAARAEIHADETYDFYAARATLSHGYPLFPSGMMWPAGGLLPYLEAPFVGFAGEVSRWARTPSVVLSTLSILALYRLTARAFGTNAGLAAALAWALDPDAILWGAYGRQYSIVPLLVFLTLIFVENAARRNCAGWSGAAAVAAYLVTVWTQLPSLLFFPAFVAAYLVLAEPRRTLAELLSALAAAAGSVAIYLWIVRGDPGLLQSADMEGGALVPPQLNSAALQQYFHRYVPFFNQYWHRAALLILALVTFAGCVFRYFATPRATRMATDRATMSLGTFFILSILGLSVLRYQQPGYALALLGPLFAIGVAGAIAIVAGDREHAASSAGGRAALMLCVVIFCWSSLDDVRRNMGRHAGDGQVAAYRYMGQHWQPGDASLNANITALLFAGPDPHFHYLCARSCGLGLMKTDKGLVNRFLGVAQISTVEATNEILDKYPRVWFAVKGSD